MTEKRYFVEPLRFEFQAVVLESNLQANGTSEVILDKTYFYPTGGGQSCDKGLIAGKVVSDVRSENGRVIHSIAGELGLGEVSAQVDSTHRLRNMQAHTGQHILSAAFLQALEGETLAVKMNAEGASTVDIALANLSEAQIDHVEDFANQVIMENRPIKSYFVPADSPKLEALRRAVKFEKVTGDVRLVEIEKFDLSACAGTHFPTTGMLGLLKILKVENYKGGSRVHFALGYEALRQLRHEHRILEKLSSTLSSSVEELVPLVQKLQTERQDFTKQVASLQENLLSYEANDLCANARKHGNYQVIKVAYHERSGEDLKILGNLLAAKENTLALLANHIGADLTVIIAASEDSGMKAGNLLKDLLGRFGGRGGGRDNYAQGVLKDFQDSESLMQALDGVLS